MGAGQGGSFVPRIKTCGSLPYVFHEVRTIWLSFSRISTLLLPHEALITVYARDLAAGGLHCLPQLGLFFRGGFFLGLLGV